MKNRRINKCLIDLSESERTTPTVMQRLPDIKKELTRIAGVLRSVTEQRMERDPRYWSQLLDGWADRLNQLGYELLIAHAHLAKQVSK